MKLDAEKNSADSYFKTPPCLFAPKFFTFVLDESHFGETKQTKIYFMSKIISLGKGASSLMLFAALLTSCSPKLSMTSPKISVNHDIQTIQEGDNITMTTTGTKGAFYKWTGPNGQANNDTTSATWSINMIGDATQYSGLYKVTEYLLKDGKVVKSAIDTISIKVKALPLCTRVSDTRFGFKKAGNYRLSIMDVDIRTTTLTGYTLCLKGDNCISITPNSNGKCFDRPSGGNSFMINCSGDCPFAIVYTELHDPGGDAIALDNAQDLANNILTFNNSKGLKVKVKVDRIK